MREWHERPMRIAALQCDFEGGRTLEVIDRWLDAGFNVEQLFHPMAEGYTAVFDPAQHADILSRYLARTKEKGLRVILYQNVHIIPPPMNDRREDWAMRTRDGHYSMLYGTYYGCCVNSPWRDYFLSVIEALAPYDLDGLFLDGPSMAGGCYCPSCRERYRRQCGGELESAADPSAFFAASRRDFVRDVYERFKRLKPRAACYWNFPVMDPWGAHASLADELPCNDILGTEGGFMFYGPARNAYLWHPSVSAKLLEAIAPGKGRVIFMAADHKPWSWYLHTPAETRLCIASSVANGASIWYGLHGSTALLGTPGGLAAVEMMRFLAAHEQYYEATASVARVAVLYAYDTVRSYRTAEQRSDFYGTTARAGGFHGNFSEAFCGVCDLLARSSVPYDLVTDFELTSQKLGRYDCVLLPTCACMGDGTCEAVRKFVADGGSIVATFDTSLYDAVGGARGNFGLGDVFGVSTSGGTTAYSNFNYFSACGPHWLFDQVGITLMPAPEFGLDVEPLGGAKVLARFHRPQAGRYTDPTPPHKPAIVLNRFEKGQIMYLAGTFAETASSYAPPEYRRLLRNAVRAFARPVVELLGGVGNVEVVVREQPGRLIVHLVNYAGVPPRPFEQVTPQVGLRLHLLARSVARARALLASMDCRVERGEGGAIIHLPVLNVYEIVVIE